MRRPVVAGNWKMNPATADEAIELARAAERAAHASPGVDVVVCPPTIWLPAVANRVGPPLALGAQTRDVLSLVIGQGVKLAITGIAMGLMASFALTRLIQTLLFGVSATDPLTFALITTLLILVSLLACWIPARRATKVDPVVALKYE